MMAGLKTPKDRREVRVVAVEYFEVQRRLAERIVPTMARDETDSG